MSGYSPGMASPGVPLYEADTSIELINPTPTSNLLSFPFIIPDYPDNETFLIKQPAGNDPQPLNPIQAIVCPTLEISFGEVVGDGTASIICIITGNLDDVIITARDYVQLIPMKGYLDSRIYYNQENPAPVSFTGLVKVLPGQGLYLIVGLIANTDTTVYSIEGVSTKFKRL